MREVVSIIIPVYNVEKYLEKCINSVLEQTFKDIKIILVDDGSTDNCGEICEKFKKIDSRIIVIHQENQGVSAARNTGISVSTGEYIGFVDPDDTIKSDMYENLIKYSFNGSIDIVVCKIRTINTVMQTEKVSNIWYKKNIVIEKDDIQQRLIKRTIVGYHLIVLIIWRSLVQAQAGPLKNSCKCFTCRNFSFL